MKYRFLPLLMAALLLSGCSAGESADAAASQPAPLEVSTAAENEIARLDYSEFFSDRDFETDYDASEAVKIEFSGSSIACDSSLVEISGTTATIKDEGCFVLSGNLDDGMLIIDAEKTDKVQLVLDGVKLNSESSAPIYVLQADKVFVTLAAGSENELSNGGSFEAIDENNIDAVIFSKDDLTMNGSGSLAISSPSGHGIACNDSLCITGGSFDINAASNGLKANDDICIADGSFIITSGKDAIQAEHEENAEKGFVYIADGSFDISAEGDAVSASAWMQIDAGNFIVLCGGGSENAAQQSSGDWGRFMEGGRRPGMGRGDMPTDMRRPGMPAGMEMPEGMAPPEMPDGGMMPPEMPMENMGTYQSVSGDGSSMKAFKANGALTINGGSFIIDSADDAFHSDLNLTINSGAFEISSGDDAFHAEENLIVTGGSINVAKSYEGLEALHLSIFGGDISVVASDDGLNAAGGVDMSGAGGRDGMFSGPMSFNSDGSILIAGGNVRITAYGDGLDANGSIEITGGDTVVCGPNYGDTAIIDYYTTATISGGSFIGTGSSMMAQGFSDSAQGMVFTGFGSRKTAGMTVDVLDSSGSTVMSFTPELDFELVIVSSPELSADENYSLSIQTQ